MSEKRKNLTRRLFLFGALATAGCHTERKPSVKDKVTLHVADWGAASADKKMGEFERQVADEWRRLHPNILIQPEHIPGSGEYVPKMLMSYLAGTEPDVIFLDASSAAVFIDNNTLLDLKPLAQRDKYDLSVYFPNVLGLASRGERLYALPADFTPMMVYYNKRLFDTAGVAYPKEGWAWEEFLETCRRLTIRPPGAARPSQYGFLAQNWMPAWIMWLWQNGGDALTPNGKRAAGALDSQASVEGIDFFTSLVLKEGVAPTQSITQSLGANPFNAGLVSMYVSGHWSIVGINASERIRLEDVGVVGLPQKKHRATVLYEAGYAISRRCKHPEEAWKYIQFVSGPFVQRKRAELGIGISANIAIAEERRSITHLEPSFLDNIQYGRAPWGAKVEGYAQVEDIGREMMEEIFVGGISPQNAAKSAAQRIDNAIGEQG